MATPLKKATPLKTIEVLGANEHNLKGIDVSIPRDQLVVITGVSGSGKSSLAFDTVFAEGQRKYMESLSSYARQFLNQMDKPDVESVEGLPPTIAIAQRSSSHNPRSTVATTTEIYDYLRLLMARCGTPRCWYVSSKGVRCDKPIESTTTTQIIHSIMKTPKNSKCMICAPVIVGRKGYHRDVLEDLRAGGFVRARVDGNVVDLRDVLLQEDENPLQLGRYELHNIEAIVDRVVMDADQRERVADSVEVATRLSSGSVLLLVEGKGGDWTEEWYSEQFSCSDHPQCSLPELEPRMFSFNSHFGACKHCDGLGSVHEFDPHRVTPDTSQSLNRKAIAPWIHSMPSMRRRYKRKLKRFCDTVGIDMSNSFESLTAAQQKAILFGGSVKGSRASYVGVIPELQKRFKQTESDNVRQWLMTYMTKMECGVCGGQRLRPQSTAVTVSNGSIDFSITSLTQMTIQDVLEVIKSLRFSKELTLIAEPILKEIINRLTFLVSVGLDYLSLDRTSSTLSGGEAQRIRLATQVGSGLVGVCYVLDEPTIGLHARDNARLLKTLRHLTDIGNTVLVVEHDELIIRSADHIIDVGPAAGIHGGLIVAQGDVEDIEHEKTSLTGDYLSRRKAIQTPESRRLVSKEQITIKQATRNNLKGIDVSFPLNSFVCVTGVSGSGKSSLVNYSLLESAKQKLKGESIDTKLCKNVTGLASIDRIIEVDQTPIGRTPRSNPATYTGIFDVIRTLFTQTRESKIRGYLPGRFSFNVKGGRCEACQGQGVKKIEMHFLPDTYVTCEECDGARYNAETLQVKWKGYTISDILNTTIEDALSIFESHPRVEKMLRCLLDVGLGYVTLGQPSTTLSGGEAQRVKLASELGVRTNNHTLYILDEPTTGLHFADIDKLLIVLQRLVDAGNTVIVIEHNIDVIKSADWIIDLGPEGGDGGGTLVAEGTPEDVAKVKTSFTGLELKSVLVKRLIKKVGKKVKAPKSTSSSGKRKACSTKN